MFRVDATAMVPGGREHLARSKPRRVRRGLDTGERGGSLRLRQGGMLPPVIDQTVFGRFRERRGGERFRNERAQHEQVRYISNPLSESVPM